MELRFHWSRTGVEVDARDDLLQLVVEALHRSGDLPEIDAPLRSLVERERMQSTAIGGGVAIPHARTSSCRRPVVAVTRLARAIDFLAPDDAPVDLVFLMISPEEATEHVQLLGELARLIQAPGVVESLRTAADDENFRAVLERAATGRD